jgi:hypothetical protein
MVGKTSLLLIVNTAIAAKSRSALAPEILTMAEGHQGGGADSGEWVAACRVLAR